MSNLSSIIDEQHRLLSTTPTAFRRYMYGQIEWRNRMLCIVGPRGVGKTTLLLQYIKQHPEPQQCLYYSVDTLTHRDISLSQIADEWVKNNGKLLVIDEIHKYPYWSQEMKHIYDFLPGLQVIFTGSSILDIYAGMADLSRRAALYTMQGLSFREYLALYHQIETPVLSLDDILKRCFSLPVEHPLPLFQDYLRQGYYPFASDYDFRRKLNQVIIQTIESDIPIYANMTAATGRKLRRLLSIIAESVPFKPTMVKLAEGIGVSRNQIADYLVYLERAGMIAQLRNDTGGIRGLGKVEKVYLDNPNLCYTLADAEPNIGNIRETFFLNQMRVSHDVISSSAADFTIGDCTFEVGGKNKSQRQIDKVERGYVVKDDIEFGGLNTLPLWAFGLTY